MNQDGGTKRNVFLTSLLDPDNNLLRNLNIKYRSCGLQSLHIVDDPHDASIIIFAETGYFGWMDLPRFFEFCRQFKSKQFIMFNQTDWPYPFIPGFFPSLGSPAEGCFSWSYFIPETDNRTSGNGGAIPKYLFSFVGRPGTHAIRRKILELDSPVSPCFDVANGPVLFKDFDYRVTYAGIMRDSRFVLCPRGYGTSSIRLFEAMRAGKAPVVISDGWRPPPAGDWDSFSIRIKEKDISDIPCILDTRRDDASEMGVRARAVFDDYFHEDVYLEQAIAFYLRAAKPLSGLNFLSRAVKASRPREVRSFVKAIIDP